MKTLKSFLLKFLVRILLCFALIFLVNEIFEWKEIPVNVGFNAVSFVVSGVLGVPGVGLLYGVAASPFL